MMQDDLKLGRPSFDVQCLDLEVRIRRFNRNTFVPILPPGDDPGVERLDDPDIFGRRRAH